MPIVLMWKLRYISVGLGRVDTIGTKSLGITNNISMIFSAKRTYYVRFALRIMLIFFSNTIFDAKSVCVNGSYHGTR